MNVLAGSRGPEWIRIRSGKGNMKSQRCCCHMATAQLGKQRIWSHVAFAHLGKQKCWNHVVSAQLKSHMNLRKKLRRHHVSVDALGMRIAKRSRGILSCRCGLPDWGSQTGSPVSFGKAAAPVVDSVRVGQLSLDSKPKEKASTTADNDSEDVSWNSWLDYFHETDELEERLRGLTTDLEEAVAREQYDEACIVKEQLEIVMAKDCVRQMCENLNAAISEERFIDAARIRDDGLNALKGWWIARTSDDPCGRLVHIRAEFGRYTGRAYTTRDIADANGWTDQTLAALGGQNNVSLEEMGQPALEVFLRRDAGGRMQHQACALRIPNPRVNPDGTLSVRELEESVLVESEKDDEGNTVRMSVSFVTKDTPEAIEEDMPSTSDSDVIELLEGNSTSLEDYQVRVAADLVWKDRDHFSLLVHNDPGSGGESDTADFQFGELDQAEKEQLDIGEQLRKGIELQIAGSQPTSLGDIISAPTNSSAGVLEQLAAAVKKMHLEKTGRKLTVDQGQIVNALGHLIGGNEFDVHAVAKIAEFLVANMQQDLGFEGDVMFSRIQNDHPKTDPFSGLYLGAFGPHGPELLLLRRSHWEDGEECVQGIKLTGDPNVPAGEVSFRVKVGRKHRLESRGIYPEDLGIIARYKGQGRVAEQGFSNPRWVEGELLQFSHTGGSMLTGGAELGFVWAVPGSRRFLILLNRWTLPDE